MKAVIKSLTGWVGVVVCASVYPGFAQTLHRVTMSLEQPAALLANAGSDVNVMSFPIVLGGLPVGSGGTEPYTYHWSPASFLSDTTAMHPVVQPGDGIDVTYELTVTDARGCVATDQVRVEIAITSVQDVENSLVRIYPNPVSKQILIECDEKIIGVKLNDQTGRAVYSFSPDEWSGAIDFRNYAEGTYMLTVITETQVRTFRIVSKRGE